METFLDGGLFELIIAIVFAYFLNFIFLKKYLLLIFSLLIITAPVILFFINKNELHSWLVAICLFNAVLLIVLLWKEKIRNPAESLFNVAGMKNKLSEIRNKINIFFQKNINSGKNKLQ